MADSNRQDIEDKILKASEVTYKRAFWKHVYRWILFIPLVGLNIAMPMSLIERISNFRVINPLFELAYFGVLFLFDLYFLPVCLFEVNSVTVRGEELIVANLLWKVKLTKKDIVGLQMPKMLASVILKTARGFYLINKADIPNVDELLTLIGQKYLPESPPVSSKPG
jgi:hypothetical protein